MPTETYETILQVANRLFAKQGYTATSVRQIAQETGIGKATIYHHFPDKQTIALALLKHNTVKMKEMLATVEAETEPRRRIQTAVQASLSFLYESSDILQVVRREVPGGRTKLQNEMASFFQTYIGLVAEALRQGQKQGIFRAMDPAEAAQVLMRMIQGTFAMTYISGQKSQPPEKAAAALLDVFFLGVEKR
jgi:TetR/AcrR family transcriptional regulator, cholesterol catabolism regulator